MDLVVIGSFTRSILIELARQLGYFDDPGIEVKETSVSSSPEQFELLEKSEINLAITNPDNVLAYRFLKNNPLNRNFDARILGAVDRGLNVCLCLRPNASETLETFGVDVPNSGFAFVGYELLSNYGYKYGSYKVISLGSTPKRRLELIGGSVDATILNAGNEIKALSLGAKKVGDVSEIGPYIGTVFSTIGVPSQSILNVINILNHVSSEILQRKHRDRVIHIAMNNLDISQQQADEHYEILCNSTHGLVPEGRVDRPSIQTLIDLRRKYLPSDELDNIMKDIDALVNTK